VDDLLSEKEQIEQMRTWWSEYGNYVIAGVVIGAALLFGFNYEKRTRLEAQYAASALYEDLTNIVVDAKVEEAEALVEQLGADYPGSNYAAQARLAMARLYMDENRDQDASDTLNDVLTSPVGEEFKQVARLRLAKIMLYQDKATAVLDLLEGMNDGAFAARYADARGDAFHALGRMDEARTAYQLALAEAGDSATVNQQFVQLKLLDLPIATFTAVADEAAMDDALVEEAPVEETPTDEDAE